MTNRGYITAIKYVCMLLVLPPVVAYASGGRTVVDSLGRSVVIPTHPQRVVVDDDTHRLFLPLFELGVPIVGACFLSQPGKSPFMYALYNLFGTTARQQGIVDVCHSVDAAAAIHALTPDVYIGDSDKQYMDNGAFIQRLSQFTPVYLQDTTAAQPLQYRLASVFNVMDRYNTLNTAYKNRLAQVRKQLPFDPTTKSFVYAKIVRDAGWNRDAGYNRILITADNSGANKAIRDLGFQLPDFMRGKTTVLLERNAWERLEQDVVFFTVDSKDPVTKRVIHNMLSTIHVQWHNFVPAVANNRVLYLDPTYTAPASFAAAIHTLDQIAWHFTHP